MNIEEQIIAINKALQDLIFTRIYILLKNSIHIFNPFMRMKDIKK
ncbi:hypothetical protein I597_1961 [Dokdonia donghaensis DSW-1]|nr:hypothetical protein I597_1961 [Dokdonia donghaensis DSW-1]